MYMNASLVYLHSNITTLPGSNTAAGPAAADWCCNELKTYI